MHRHAHRASNAAVILLVALTLDSCAATRPKSTAPLLTRVPSMAVEALCTKVRYEGVGSGASLYVVRTTQPLVTGPSLRSLAHAYFKDGELGGVAQALSGSLAPVEVDLSEAHSCQWKPVDRLDPLAHAQFTVVEFSSPFVNPFTRGESGVLARMSIGGHDAQWYWIPLAEMNGVLRTGLVLPMDLHDA